MGSGESAFDRAASQAVVAQIQAGTLVADSAGVVQLPAPLQKLSSDTRVYVTTSPAYGQCIAFPTWRGKGANVRAYVFCSQLTPLPLGQTVSLNLPVGGIPGGARSMPVEVVVERNPFTNWFYVSRSDD
ncbi:MAG: hypothetical protein QOF78_1840 [Phycisphaerales bacterium]|jgi:hypothetical protein|nr:hypothetical protein [Phycisphaerales bacterium]